MLTSLRILISIFVAIPLFKTAIYIAEKILTCTTTRRFTTGQQLYSISIVILILHE